MVFMDKNDFLEKILLNPGLFESIPDNFGEYRTLKSVLREFLRLDPVVRNEVSDSVIPEFFPVLLHH